MTPLFVARQYFESWTHHRFAEAAACLSDDVHFEMPINSYSSKDAFMNAVIFTAQNSSSVQLLSALGNDQEAVLIYDFVFAPVGHFRIAEHFLVKDGKITAIRHIHDTHPLRNAGMGG